MDLSELPDELQDEAPESLDRDQVLDDLCNVIAKKRDEAVAARAASGIEETWEQCEEAYLCIDEMNRGTDGATKWVKPTTMTGPLTSYEQKGSDGRSTAFIRLTARYVDMGAAKIGEIVLPIDDKAFSLNPTPVPDLINDKDDPTPITHPETGQNLMRQGPDGQPPQPVTKGDLAKIKLNKAKDAAEKAERRILDWMVEADYHGQMRRVLHDSARIGVGVLKAPYPVTKKSRSVSRDGDAIKIDMLTKVVPGFKRISPWNFYPDPGCGEDIHSGDYCVEADSISEATLRGLKNELDVDGKPVYITQKIDLVIEQGPDGHKETETAWRKNNKKNYRIWYFTGVLSRKDIESITVIGLSDLPDEVIEVGVIVTMVNDSIIRVTLNPLDGERFCYRALPWSPRADYWAGVGVAEQVREPQKIVNSASRAVFNNAGVSAGVQIIMDPLSVIAANGDPMLTPNKLWHTTGDSTVDDVRKVFAAIEIPNVTAQLMPIIEYGMKLAEESTNIPLISQGHDGEAAPQTFGQAQLQNTNANTLLRDLAYAIDGYITRPVVEDCYDWLLMDPDVPIDEKGDFEIDAKGSISLVEKAIQEQTLMLLGQMVVNPAFGADPEKWFEEMLKAKRMDPRKIVYSEEEKAKRAQQPPPEAPAITAAKIRAQSDQATSNADNQARFQAANIQAQATLQRSKMDTDRDTVYVNAENQRNQNDHEARMSELTVKRELALLEYATQNKQTLDKVKADLAQTSMKLQVQKELSLAALNVDVHKHHTQPIDAQVITPPTEPAGKAPEGQAFEA